MVDIPNGPQPWTIERYTADEWAKFIKYMNEKAKAELPMGNCSMTAQK